MEGDEVERRALLAGGVVDAAEAVLEEVGHELAAGAGGVRAADARGGQSAADAGDGVVVELAEFLGAAAPVAVGWLFASFQTSHHQVFTSAAPYFSTECFAHWYTSSPHFA